eukprot:scaffold308809_cov16-Prasinocladus_malaysianus.AAC.2
MMRSIGHGMRVTLHQTCAISFCDCIHDTPPNRLLWPDDQQLMMCCTESGHRQAVTARARPTNSLLMLASEA